MIDLSVSNCSYSLAKKDANLRPVAQRTLSLFAKELVSIYEVKIPARLTLVFKGLSTHPPAVETNGEWACFASCAYVSLCRIFQ